MQSTCESRFCKDISTSCWPTSVIMERSVTGTLSDFSISNGVITPYKELSPVKKQTLSGVTYSIYALASTIAITQFINHCPLCFLKMFVYFPR